MNEKLQQYVEKLLREAQEQGYVTPENSDYEVGQWMMGVSRQIANKADNLFEPERFVKVNGRFYRVRDIEKLSEVLL